MKQAKQIFRDALLLTGAALLMRTVGVWFQIAISNRAGAEAMGLFSLMSGVYGFALTLATSGIHLGVTRMVTETVSRGRSDRVPGLLRRAAFQPTNRPLFCAGPPTPLRLRLSLHYIRFSPSCQGMKADFSAI